ncbi:MAG: tetratricopeptide repeat protein [Polyangiaceae bacterium]|nr:tetratricopeptide repeat protein [Polyangiaceae bacterium]
MMRRGDSARRAARWSDAAGFYRAALEEAIRAGVDENEQAVIAGELGLCELALGRFRDAAEHLRRSLHDVTALPPWKRAKLTEAYARVHEKVTRLTISVTPPDAEVLIDGQPIGSGKPTYLVFLDPGPHTARARLARHQDAVHSLTAVPGTPSGIEMTFPQAATPATEAAAPERPVPPVAPPAEPADGGTAVHLRRVGFIAAGAAAVLGVSFTISAAVVHENLLDKTDGVTRRHGPSTCAGGRASGVCDELESAGAMRDALSGLGVWSFVAASVFAGVTVSSLWWAPSDGSPAPVQVVPAVEPGQAGLTLRSSW